MRFKSIQAKVLIALVICLVLGTGCVVELMHYFTAENSRALGTEAATGSQKLFTILEASLSATEERRHHELDVSHFGA